MCGIAGVLSKEDEDVVPLLRGMLESIKHRGPDGVGVTVSGKVCHSNTIAEIDWDNIHGYSAVGHTRLAVVGGSHGHQPFASNDGRLILLHNGEIYNYKALREPLESHHRFESRTDSEVLVHLLAEHYNGNLFQTFNNIVPQLDGVYAIAVTDGEDIVIARDLIGVKQLYWGEDEKILAFASEKKSLWSIGLRDNIHRMFPGEIICLSPDGLEKTRRKPDFLRAKDASITEFEKALETYRIAMMEAVRKRIPELDRVGVIFSGGVDSVLIAAIVKELGANLTCYTSGMKDSSDVDYAERAAGQIGFPLRINRLDDEDLLEFIPKVISCIEDRSLGQVEVAIPILASVELAHEDGQIVLLTGQGADELFGGYPWYRHIIELDGYDEFEFRMWDDLNHLYNETLEREDKITMAYGIEVRVPFLDPQVIRAAFSIDSHLKIRSAEDKIGKYIHRALASSLGIPEEIAWRPKEAAQHGAGIHSRFLALADKQGFEKAMVEKLHYHMEDALEENLGSSQRYGFKYDPVGRWATQDNVQLWLDNLAYKHDLLSPAEKEQLIPYLKSAAKLNHK